jgi:hypothetical protein
MSFYDDASLVVIPSGYKTSKVYAEKPTDGSGDLTFTRTGDTATRVNSAGLVEKVRTNLVLQSETFATTWAPTSAAVTSNVTTAPNGALTADKLIASVSAVTQHRVDQTTTSAIGINVFSVYAKKAELTFLNLRVGTSGAYFNLDNGTTSDLVGVTSAIENAGNGWYRCIIVRDSSVANEVVRINLATAIGVNSFTGDGTSGAFIWGAQLERGDIATAYIPTTTAAVSTGPVANVPRLDYLGSSCPRLLLEPQRTNLLQFSEQFNNAYWLKFRLDLGINTQISPSGIQNADTFTSSVGAVDIPVIATQTFTYVGNTRYSSSIFVKKIGNVNSFQISYVDNATGYTGGRVTYNVVTQAITITQSPNASVTATMENVGNGWYRLVLNFLTIAVPTYNYIAFEIPTTSITNTFAIWGAQLEAGAYATSYIPTLAAAATRGADACLKTGISSLIGQTEGVLFVNAVLTHSTGATNEYLAQVNASANNRILIYRQTSTNKLGAILIVGGAVIYSVLTSGAITSTAKVAFAYKSGDFAFYVNGTQVGTSSATYTTPPSMGSFDLDSNGGTENGFYSYNQALLFKTRLTNAQMAELTTL